MPGVPTCGLDVAHLSVAYAARMVLEDVCLQCRRGQIVGLLGPNGSGKSTLLKSVLGLAPRISGDVSLDGHPLVGPRMKARVAYVPQRSDVDWGFPINVEEVVLLGCQGRLGLCGRPGKAERAAALAALERMHMSSFRRSQIGELSGGQQQRVFLARALAQGGDTLLLDEPLTGLDATTQAVVLGLLDELRCDGQSIVIATHDVAEASQLCDELCLIRRRVIGFGPPGEVLTAPMLLETYGAYAVPPGADDGTPGAAPAMASFT
jgi:ABC-type Mn2+/Zn2+ transport system ATPase subunit